MRSLVAGVIFGALMAGEFATGAVGGDVIQEAKKLYENKQKGIEMIQKADYMEKMGYVIGYTGLVTFFATGAAAGALLRRNDGVIIH